MNVVKDNAAYIEHCEKQIEIADKTIELVENARKNSITGDPVNNVEKLAKAEKHIYETLLKKESQ